MAGRINTAKVLQNSYYSGESINTDFSSQTMTINPMVEDQYDFALTDDIVLLNERKNTAEKIYEIFINSQYANKFRDKNGIIIKIPKENIKEVFEYTRDELLKVKSLNPSELIMAINEFYDFNYSYICNKVLTPAAKQELLEDYKNNLGMSERIEKGASEQLF